MSSKPHARGGSRLVRIAAATGLLLLVGCASGNEMDIIASDDAGSDASGGMSWGGSSGSGGWGGGAAGAAAAGGSGGSGGAACLSVTTPCQSKSECCGDLSCDKTTLGTVCCGEEGASCTTANGEDCCRDLLCVSGKCVSPNACLAVKQSCSATSECCGNLSCDTTSLGKTCCGEPGESCSTANGEDCCRDLLCVSGKCTSPSTGGKPNFQAPFPCNQVWTYSHHSQEVRLALDFINTSGGTDNARVLASAAGTAYRMAQRDANGNLTGAGLYIVVVHTGGWKTYYFHLQSYSVADGASVSQGQEVGRVGSTGASSGPHLHYEQLLNGVGQTIVLNGSSLAPYPGTYGQRNVTSYNCP